MSDDEDWFAPKQFGYGAGMPIAWQGWAIIAIFTLVLVIAGLWLMPAHPVPFVVVAIIASLALSLVAAQHTRGGWRWRWGGED